MRTISSLISPRTAISRANSMVPDWMRFDRHLNDVAVRNAAVAVTEDLIRAQDRSSARAALVEVAEPVLPSPRRRTVRDATGVTTGLPASLAPR